MVKVWHFSSHDGSSLLRSNLPQLLTPGRTKGIESDPDILFDPMDARELCACRRLARIGIRINSLRRARGIKGKRFIVSIRTRFQGDKRIHLMVNSESQIILAHAPARHLPNLTRPLGPTSKHGGQDKSKRRRRNNPPAPPGSDKNKKLKVVST